MASKGDMRGLRDVDMYIKQIQAINKSYVNIVAKLAAVKADKKRAMEKMDLLTERDGVKQSFIAKKQACRANIKLLPENVAILKERELKDLQDEYREIDTEFKALGVMVERNELMSGAAEPKGGAFDVSRATNDELLGKATDVQASTTQKLKDGLATLEATKEQAKFTAAQLEADREKMQRISKGLDEVDSELELSRKLLTRFIKRIYTDKVIIAFTTLLVLGIVGIIVYTQLNPDQTTFSVPDVLNPSAATSSLSGAANSAVNSVSNTVSNTINSLLSSPAH